MRVAFERWLATPSTLCFLRRLVPATDNNATLSPRQAYCSPLRRHSTLPNGSLVETVHEMEGNEEKRPRNNEHSGTATPDDIGENALRAKFTSATQHTEPIAPERALRALQKQASFGSGSGHGRSLGELAVDRPENRDNFALWANLLQFRQRVDGFEGILDVWRAMRRREIDLPTKGTEADILWPIFIHAGIRSPFEERHDRLLQSVVQHARDIYPRSGVYAGLHRCLVGRWLRLKPAAARNWHNVLLKHFGITRIDWPSLATDFALAKERNEALKTFKVMHGRSQRQCGLYGYFIPQTLKHQGETEALRWHRRFLKWGDGPDHDTFQSPAVQRLFELDGNASLPMVHAKQDRATAKPLPISQEQAQFLPLTRATMSTLVGDVHGIKPKEVSDSFVAKMFATYAFSLDLVITGLGFFGVDNLGALAIREMAVKAGTFSHFRDKLEDLKSCGIGVNRSVYGRLMQKIAQQGPTVLFDHLMASDQHPESYEDISTQNLLLASFLQKKDFINAHITLMGLSLAGPLAHEGAWNQLLQQYIYNRDRGSILRTAEQMQTSGMAFNNRTLTFMHRNILPDRRPSMGPIKTPREDVILNPLQFTTNAYIHSATKGVCVEPALWIENLKRYGMMQRWDELERLVLWLANFYTTNTPPHPSNFRGVLQTIFSRNMRSAIVTWGFRQDKWLQPVKDAKGSSACESWAKGLALLSRLRSYGLHTTSKTAREAFLQRMWVLFGPAYSTKAVNVEARRNNGYTLAHFVRHANEVWNGQLFPDIDPRLLNDDPPNHPKLLAALFGPRRRVSKQRQEYADVCSYAEFLAQNRVTSVPLRRNGLARREIWRRSPFRILSSRKPTRRVEIKREAPLRH